MPPLESKNPFDAPILAALKRNLHITDNELDAIRDRTMPLPTLDELALKHSTDKNSTGHNYTPHYDQLFTPLRHQPITLLELGYLEGASAKTWAEYFTHPDRRIIMIDIGHYLPKTDHDSVHLYPDTDQTDVDKLTKIHQLHGDYHIIIDDAGHNPQKILASYEILFPMLKPGGHYIIEDTHSSNAIQELNRYFKIFIDERQWWIGVESITYRYDLIIIRKTKATDGIQQR
jgi:hypothetical protein